MLTVTTTAPAAAGAGSSTSIAARRPSTGVSHESVSGSSTLSSRHRTGSTSNEPRRRDPSEEWVELQDIPLGRASTAEDSVPRSGESTITAEDRDASGTLPLGTSLWDRILWFWKSHVSVSVDIRASRDHLALERTFLAYLRTSAVGAVTGTTISQLFVLGSDNPGSDFNYSTVGKPLATACYIFAILTIAVGTYRVWRLQKTMLNGKALARGSEPMSVFVATACLLACLAGITVALDFLV
ncbi:hypothetical protein HOO65_080283 [Ceratocystis lukuohia]|uniref:DUF202 domain-containing protein n=1 Tax=Ceratocystis lukuohia TaxID=2019550 RepID=A0ABR4MAS2_9PEZI